MKSEENELDILREGIDNIDLKIIELLANRFEIVGKIGNLKKNLDIDVVDTIRETALLEKLKTKASENGLRHDFVDLLWECILKESHYMQHNIVGEKD